jgi:membrane-anchored protein YejM (alkaline phosphatase superfamily)
MESQINLLLFDKRIFWDVDFQTLRLEQDAVFIIERVFDRGDVPDIRNCRRHYGDERITQVLLNAKHLSKHRLYLASAIIDRPITEFRCYMNGRLTQNYSPY